MLKLTWFPILLMSTFSSMSFAGAFEVKDSTVQGYYGNAEDADFKAAIRGRERNQMDTEYMEEVESMRTSNRGYVRFLVGKPRLKLEDLRNSSSSDSIFADFPVASPTQSRDLLNLWLAGGYLWESWAIEMELWLSKNFDYMANPVLVGRPEQIKASVKEFALLFNVQYVLPRWFDFYPKRLHLHLDAGVGPAYKLTHIDLLNADGTSRGGESARRLAAAAQLGVGARYQISDSFLIDIAYRYLFLGRTKFGPSDRLQLKSNRTTVKGFFAGLTYQF